MADDDRIEELRHRIRKDPASIAFAQLAEEYRRLGNLREAVEICRTGLAVHPGYVSARVTLGRALLTLNRLDEARREFEEVLKTAPENLAAVRGLAEIHHDDDDGPGAAASAEPLPNEQIVAALERFLSAIHVARAERRA